YTASDKIKIRPHKINFNTDTTGIGYVMDEQHIARLEENGLTIWNIHSLETKRIPFRYSSENYIESSYLFYDINQDRFFIGYSDGGIVRISQDKVDSCSRAVESIAAIIGKQHNYILMMD